ncbi:MAG: amidohydrolase family protein [Gemmatimonadetes bacterium]|nr:amidohydrolase family protein [Gemmatimonadota bacterium]
MIRSVTGAVTRGTTSQVGRRAVGAAWAVMTGCVGLAGCADSSDPPADLVLTGGRVITLDAQRRVAEAVAVRGERVTAVGTVDEIEALTGPETRRVDLDGRAVTPGLMDAHVHFASGGANRLYRLDMSYPNVENIADVQAMVAEQAGLVGEGEWVRAGAGMRGSWRRCATSTHRTWTWSTRDVPSG